MPRPQFLRASRVIGRLLGLSPALSLALVGTALAQPANDDFANRQQVTKGFTAGPFAIVSATTEPGELTTPSCAPGGIVDTVWYTWWASAGDIELFAETAGSTYDTVIVVYSGGLTVDTQTELACDDDGGAGVTSALYFDRDGPNDLNIQVGRKAGTADGDLRFAFDRSTCQNGTVELREECDDQTTGTCCEPDCTARPEGSFCSDGDVCTGIGGDDSCDAVGNCVPGPPDPCDDANPCTTNECIGGGFGCRNLPQAGSCEDGDPCTSGDACNVETGQCDPGAPVLADADSDGVCDFGDNCPFVSNAAQTQSDSLPAGDACQCGDLDEDGDVDQSDVTIAGQIVVGSSAASGAPRTRCNVVGASDGGVTDCGVDDVALLDRHASGRGAAIGDVCDAYLNP